MTLCEGGCGQTAPLVTRNEPAQGNVRGQPRRFIPGHNNYVRTPLWERILATVSPGGPTDCWVWRAKRTDGYGSISVNGKNRLAHKVVYELTRGPVPDGLELDHLCRNTLCVNPAHLEAVTHRENMLRGVNPVARQARRSTCSRGHSLGPDGDVRVRGNKRQCRACLRVTDAARRARRKAAA